MTDRRHDTAEAIFAGHARSADNCGSRWAGLRGVDHRRILIEVRIAVAAMHSARAGSGCGEPQSAYRQRALSKRVHPSRRRCAGPRPPSPPVTSCSISPPSLDAVAHLCDGAAMTERISIKSGIDGYHLPALHAEPRGDAVGGVVVRIEEIFGLTLDHIAEMCDTFRRRRLCCTRAWPLRSL